MSLIEILTIIAIIAVLVTVSIPAYRALVPAIELDNLYQEATSQLREAQYKALETQTPQVITLYGVTVTWNKDGTPDSAKDIIIQHNGQEETIQINASGHIR